MISTTRRTAAVGYDQGLRNFMLSVFNNMGIGMALSGLIAYLASTNSALMSLLFGGPQAYVIIFAPLVMSLVIGFGIDRMQSGTAKMLFYVFCVLMGLSMSTVFMVYTANSIATAFFSTGAMFGAMSLYGYTTKRDLTKIGSFLIMGAIGVVIASVINVFVQSSMLTFVVSGIAVIVFTGLTAFDVQNLKNIYLSVHDQEQQKKAGILGALSLYINFINIFISLLQLFGERK